MNIISPDCSPGIWPGTGYPLGRVFRGPGHPAHTGHFTPISAAQFTQKIEFSSLGQNAPEGIKTGKSRQRIITTKSNFQDTHFGDDKCSFFVFLIYFQYLIYMKTIIEQGVANYLNNKFGDDFTLAEPWPEWMRLENNQRADVRYKCWCEAEDDLLVQLFQEEGEKEECEVNVAGYLRLQVSNDDENERNIISLCYEEV